MTSTAADVALFMSVDLSGSTAFKAAAHGDGDSPNWLAAFEAFFREVPLIMMGQLAAVFSEEEEVPECAVWKVIGDEIVFLAHPESARQAQLLTLAFYNTVLDYDRKMFERWPLRLRGCCWAAQISNRNRRLEIPEMMGTDASQVYRDYLGPDVDTGFRLAACGGRGQVIVSSNLVYALAGLEESEQIRFHYVGKQVLKGVNMGRPYPLFLMSSSDRLPECWEWEDEDDQGVLEMQKNTPMPYDEIRGFIEQIQSYLNRMCHAGMEPLRFKGVAFTLR